eukprot:1514724-Pleurochrysis_carterae.AAC.2
MCIVCAYYPRLHGGFLRALKRVRGRRVPRHGPWCGAPLRPIAGLRVGVARRTLAILNALSVNPIDLRPQFRPTRCALTIPSALSADPVLLVLGRHASTFLQYFGYHAQLLHSSHS